MPQNLIYIGPAGWHYPDWKGLFYVPGKSRSLSELSYLAQFFNVVEINTTFYRIPEPKIVANWNSQVEKFKSFQFIAKLYQGFTHMDSTPSDQDVQRFIAALLPLHEAGRLITVLAQYPWRVKYSDHVLNRIITQTLRLRPLPVHFEFRHGSWFCEQVLERLAANNIGWVNIDQPVIGDSLGPTDSVTNGIAYVRLHGRNYNAWFNENAGRDQRYDYCYTKQELQVWRETLQKFSAMAQKTVVIFNNHFRGQAIVNSMQMQALLHQVPLQIPSQLAAAYPILNELGSVIPDQQTLSLF